MEIKIQNIDDSIEELSAQEALTFNGGESLWYWVTYGAGRFIHAFANQKPDSGARTAFMALH